MLLNKSFFKPKKTKETNYIIQILTTSTKTLRNNILSDGREAKNIKKTLQTIGKYKLFNLPLPSPKVKLQI